MSCKTKVIGRAQVFDGEVFFLRVLIMRQSVVSRLFLMVFAFSATGWAAEAVAPAKSIPVVNSLWLIHRYGTPQAVRPEQDAEVKIELVRMLTKDKALTAAGVSKLMNAETFARLAGDDGRIDATEVENALAADVPATRKMLFPAVEAHCRLLSTGLDQIDPAHREAATVLVEWIVANYKPGESLPILCVCTGNSRRSMLGSTMGNIAAAYYGLPEIQCYSGGTDPSAMNSRTMTALKAIGVQIDPQGSDAPRGVADAPNPFVCVRWGTAATATSPAMETVEFSKRYSDAHNPQHGFAALMVCGEAEEACPTVRGQSIRIPMRYLDPKMFDGTEYETAKYAERRDDIGRFMMSVMMQVRNRLSTRNQSAGK